MLRKWVTKTSLRSSLWHVTSTRYFLLSFPSWATYVLTEIDPCLRLRFSFRCNCSKAESIGRKKFISCRSSLTDSLLPPRSCSRSGAAGRRVTTHLLKQQHAPETIATSVPPSLPRCLHHRYVIITHVSPRIVSTATWPVPGTEYFTFKFQVLVYFVIPLDLEVFNFVRLYFFSISLIYWYSTSKTIIVFPHGRRSGSRPGDCDKGRGFIIH